MSHRNLQENEVKILVQQGCTAADWDAVQVADGFDPLRVQRCHFSDRVRLGRYQKELHSEGIPVLAGLYDSTLHDCTVGDDACIRQARLTRYDVGTEVLIDNVDELTVSGSSGFGNGVRINVLNETGGRTLTLFDRLSAQIAYLLVIYRHDVQLVKSLETLIDKYVKTRISSRGSIGTGARITHSGRIRNVAIGPHAEISGVLRLDEGTVASCPEDPAKIGTGVIAEDFIMLSGCRVTGSVHLESCFVGQGVHLGRQFSAEHSAFFANCEGDHSEVVSVCAGPYSVSHHKSTLLIASMVSFFNAGSGTNQSNHMYKLGPVHQGVMERGCKTGSSSYFLFPCRIGPFTTVTGKHYANFDSDNLPFSNIADKDGASVLTPAVNLLTVGARRDSEKWPARDRRKDPDKLDLIHFKLLNPFTVGRMVKGAEILQKLSAETPKEKESVTYQGVHIRRLMLKTTARYYEIGIKVFIGACLYEKILPLTAETDWIQIKAALQTDHRPSGSWIDLLGLLAPQDRLAGLIKDVSTGAIETIDALTKRFQDLHTGYPEDEWTWCINLIESRLGIDYDQLRPQHLSGLVEDWRDNAVKLNRMIIKDAEKEFDPFARISYGLDGDTETTQMDFEQVRGSAKDNTFVQQLENEITTLETNSAAILEWLQSL